MKERVMWLVCGAFIIDLIFDLAPDSEVKRSFFPFFHGYGNWDGSMTLQNYVYGYCQHAFLVMIFHAVYVHTGRKFWESLMWLEIVDVFDYALHYNHTLFTLWGHSIEYNYFKFLAVVYLTHKEYAAGS